MTPRDVGLGSHTERGLRDLCIAVIVCGALGYLFGGETLAGIFAAAIALVVMAIRS